LKMYNNWDAAGVVVGKKHEHVSRRNRDEILTNLERERNASRTRNRLRKRFADWGGMPAWAGGTPCVKPRLGLYGYAIAKYRGTGPKSKKEGTRTDEKTVDVLEG